MQDTTPTPDQHTAQHQAVLAELTAMGLDIARLLAQAEGHHDPDARAPAWTHSGPHRPAPPRGTPDTHGITPEDRALHAHILAQGRQRR